MDAYALLKRLENALVACQYFVVIKIYLGQAVVVKDCAVPRR